jgi:hypothetical protein
VRVFRAKRFGVRRPCAAFEPSTPTTPARVAPQILPSFTAHSRFSSAQFLSSPLRPSRPPSPQNRLCYTPAITRRPATISRTTPSSSRNPTAASASPKSEGLPRKQRTASSLTLSTRRITARPKIRMRRPSKTRRSPSITTLIPSETNQKRNPRIYIPNQINTLRTLSTFPKLKLANLFNQNDLPTLSKTAGVYVSSLPSQIGTRELSGTGGGS